MAQEVKISAVKSDSQDLITGIHIVVGEKQFQQSCPLASLGCQDTYDCAH